MKSPVVRLKIRVRFADGSRPYLDPVTSANGKLKPLYAVVHGEPEHHPEGSYFLRYAREGKRVWESVGTDAQLALLAKLKREKSFEAKAAGVELVEDKPQQKLNPSLRLSRSTSARSKTRNQRRRTSRIRTLCGCSSKQPPTTTWSRSIAGTCSPSLS